jgi:hypothetical protein
LRKILFLTAVITLVLSFAAGVAAENPWAVVPFYVAPATDAPVIDGVIGDDEWKGAYTYPFAFNQLNNADLRPPAADDSSGDWRLLYKGDTIYGLVRRVDNKTHIRAGQPHENDCVELFFKTDSTFRQMRALVGRKFDTGFSGGKVETAWSEDGTILEFAVQIPGMDLAGKNLGWNIALADNDGLFRKTQLYPIPGANRSWQQRDLAEIVFLLPGKNTHEPITKSFAEFPAFIAKKTDTAPVIDGNIDDEIWKQGIIYPFAFNQLNSTNQVPPAADDSSGSWVLLYQGDTVYGLVRRVDNKTNIRASQPHENDCVELFFKTDSTFRQMRALVGKKFDAGFSGGKVETAWNEDGTILEFAVQIPGMDLAGKSIGWNIALADNDGLFRKTQLYPVKGFNRSWQQQDLAELHFEQ